MKKKVYFKDFFCSCTNIQSIITDILVFRRQMPYSVAKHCLGSWPHSRMLDGQPFLAFPGPPFSKRNGYSSISWPLPARYLTLSTTHLHPQKYIITALIRQCSLYSLSSLYHVCGQASTTPLLVCTNCHEYFHTSAVPRATVHYSINRYLQNCRKL